MDHHVRAEITAGLRARGIDVLTAHEDAHAQADDPILLDRAGELGRILFSQDSDLLVEAALRQRSNRNFSGLIYGHQLRISIGQCVNDLELLCGAFDPPDMENGVIYLPL